MNDLVTATARWTISTRSGGEDLAAQARGEDLELAVVGQPAGFSAAEVEAWLKELLGVARQTTGEAAASDERPAGPRVPTLMHHALTGLLFYEAELWGAPPEATPCSCAFTNLDGRVAFGWTGAGQVELWLDGAAVEPDWVRVRDDRGNLAQVLSVESHHSLKIRAGWPREGSRAFIEAAWPGEGTHAPAPVGSATPAGIQSAEPTREAEDVGEPHPSGAVATGLASANEASQALDSGTKHGWRFPGWVERLVGQRRAADERPVGSETPEVETTASERLFAGEIGETPPDSRAEVDAPLPRGPANTEPIAFDVEGVPDLIGGPQATGTEPARAGQAIQEAGGGRTDRESIPGEDERVAAGMEPAPAERAPVEDEVPASKPPAHSSTPLPVFEAAGWEEALFALESEADQPTARWPGVDAEPATPSGGEIPVVLPGFEEDAPEHPAQVATEPAVETTAVEGPTAFVDPYSLPDLPSAPEPSIPEPLVTESNIPGSSILETMVGDAASEVEPALVPVATPSQSPVQESAEPAVQGAGEVLAARVRARPRRLELPDPDQSVRSGNAPLWKRPWFAALLVVALFAAGWAMGRLDQPLAGPSRVAVFLRSIGLGPARFELMVTSRPAGAWLSVDGVDQARRTPTRIELKPGRHQVGLSFTGLGGATYAVQGKRGQRVALDAELRGSIRVADPGGGIPIAVGVDGLARGYAPLVVDGLAPGTHRVQFSGPGVTPWEEVVEVRVSRAAEIYTQPVAAPATGVLEIRATTAGDEGAEDVTGAALWIDGEPRGQTPLRLELPRGPHSVRARWRGEDLPVQVIDLPGGNQRFLRFEFGLSIPGPRLVALLPGRVPLDRPLVLSASLDEVRSGDVREMWLHVRTPEGAWRRYPMSMMRAPGGVVGAVPFPAGHFDARGRTAWYVSATIQTGDEYFTELQPAQAEPR